MKALAIVMEGNAVSEKGFERLKQSSVGVGNDFEIHRFEAVTPATVDQVMEMAGVTWNYPQSGVVMDRQTGLRKTGYGGRDPKRRQACGMSHYMLWQLAANLNEPV